MSDDDTLQPSAGASGERQNINYSPGIWISRKDQARVSGLDDLRQRLMDTWRCASTPGTLALHQRYFMLGVDAALAALEAVPLSWCVTHGCTVRPADANPDCKIVPLYRIVSTPGQSP